MHKIKGLNYQKPYVQLSLLAASSGFIINLILFVIFCHHYLEYSLYKSCLIYTWFTIAFTCTFMGIYWQRKSDTYKLCWPVFAIILGISNGFLISLAGRTLFFAIGDINELISPLILTSFVTIIFSVLAAYLSLRVTYRLTQNRFLFYSTATYLIGVIFATMNTRVFDWWYSSICALGMPSRQNSDIYNSTLIIIGMLMVLFVAYIAPQFKALLQKGLMNRPKIITISIIYLMELIGIMSIGIFPFGINNFVSSAHVFFGGFVFYNIGLLMLLAAWLFSNFPAKFLHINYLLLFISVLCYSVSFVLCLIVKVKWFAFPLAEFITAIIIAAWVLTLLNYVRRLSGIRKA